MSIFIFTTYLSYIFDPCNHPVKQAGFSFSFQLSIFSINTEECQEKFALGPEFPFILRINKFLKKQFF